MIKSGIEGEALCNTLYIIIRYQNFAIGINGTITYIFILPRYLFLEYIGKIRTLEFANRFI